MCGPPKPRRNPRYSITTATCPTPPITQQPPIDHGQFIILPASTVPLDVGYRLCVLHCFCIFHCLFAVPCHYLAGPSLAVSFLVLRVLCCVSVECGVVNHQGQTAQRVHVETLDAWWRSNRTNGALKTPQSTRGKAAETGPLPYGYLRIRWTTGAPLCAVRLRLIGDPATRKRCDRHRRPSGADLKIKITSTTRPRRPSLFTLAPKIDRTIVAVEDAL